MKPRITRKDVFASYNAVIQCGYCQVQSLTAGLDPVGYTAGVYGWNADVYEIAPGVALVTGYRPFGREIPAELARKYNAKAGRLSTAHYARFKANCRRIAAAMAADALKNK